MSSRRRWLVPLVLIGLITSGVTVFWVTSKSSDTLLAEAQRAFDARNFPECERLAKRILKRERTGIDAAMLASRAAFAMGDLPGAYGYLKEVFGTTGPTAMRAHSAGGEIQLRLRNAADAEMHFRKALKIPS